MDKFNPAPLEKRHAAVLEPFEQLARDIDAIFNDHRRQYEDVLFASKREKALVSERSRRLRLFTQQAKQGVGELERWQRERRDVAETQFILNEIRAQVSAEMLSLPGTAKERTTDQEAEFSSLRIVIQQIDMGPRFDETLRGFEIHPRLKRELEARITPTWDGSREVWRYLHGSLTVTDKWIRDVDKKIAEATDRLKKLEAEFIAFQAASTAPELVATTS